ncbi:hypothetical protein VTO73DRAFT_11346 [Trametes versicolor]
MKITVHTLKKRRNGDGRLSSQYTASLAGVEGEIVGVRAMELAVTELIVSNKNPRSTIEWAYLSVQHLEGVTVALGFWRAVWRTISLPFLPHTRHVPLERGDIIARERIGGGGRGIPSDDGGNSESDESEQEL